MHRSRTKPAGHSVYLRIACPAHHPKHAVRRLLLFDCFHPTRKRIWEHRGQPTGNASHCKLRCAASSLPGPFTASPTAGRTKATMGRANHQSRASATEAPNPNVFDDEYAVNLPDVEVEFSVADGLAESGREVQLESSTRRRSRTQSSTERRSGIQPGKEAGERSEPARTRRSSIAKEMRSSLDSTTGAFDHIGTGSHGLPSRTTSRAEDGPFTQHNHHIPLRNRPLSTASSFATFDDSGPSCRGEGGPSHPYHLFPQAGVPRQPSLSHSTLSRQRPSLYTPSQPAHPYGLYQQTSFPVGDSEAAIVPAIPVGFPGRPGNFGRQIGPDGEDQGIVGPDGHTEDLPPYSKYPDAPTVKPVCAAAAAAAPISPVSPVDGPSTVSRAIPSSQDELVSPIVPADNSSSLPQGPLPPPVPRAIPSQSSNRDLQTRSPRSSGYSIKDEKAWRDKTWREKRRTRVCGGRLPIWALLVAISILLFIVILAGGVIGGLLAVGKSREYARPTSRHIPRTNESQGASNRYRHINPKHVRRISDTGPDRTAPTLRRAIRIPIGDTPRAANGMSYVWRPVQCMVM